MFSGDRQDSRMIQVSGEESSMEQDDALLRIHLHVESRCDLEFMIRSSELHVDRTDRLSIFAVFIYSEWFI